MVNLIPTKEEWNKALAERHGEKLQKKFSEAIVAVCGLGGLGSNIAIALARAGVGKLILIDFDCVDITNLHRQQYKANQIGMNKTDALFENLKEIAPYVEIEIHSARITEDNAMELLADADIICEAFDNAECKAMLTNFVLEATPEKFLVCASGMAGMGSANTIQTRKVGKRFYVCGDGRSDVSEVGSLVSSRESAEFRNGIVKIAATKVSAGVSTGIGDHESKYTGKESEEVQGDEQFEIDDNRSLDKMYKDIAEEGLQPVLNDYLYV